MIRNHVGIILTMVMPDYLDYGDATVFDSTYKVNRYGMPFIPFVGLNNHRCTTVFACAIVSDETEGTYVWLLETF